MRSCASNVSKLFVYKTRLRDAALLEVKISDLIKGYVSRL
jgi:hypothetical protein